MQATQMNGLTSKALWNVRTSDAKIEPPIQLLNLRSADTDEWINFNRMLYKRKMDEEYTI